MATQAQEQANNWVNSVLGTSSGFTPLSPSNAVLSAYDIGTNQTVSPQQANLTLASQGYTPTGQYVGTQPAPTPQPGPAPINNNVGSVGYDPTFDGQTVTVNGASWKAYKLPNGQLAWQSLGGQDDLMKQINDAYSSSYDYFNQAEGNLKSQLPQTIGSINQNYDLNSKMLTDQNSSNVGQLNEQVDTAGQKNETQMAQIRRLYNELNQGYRQRFGGATSAGQAASELANVEQQRQTGNQMSNYNQTVRQINLQKSDIDQKYQNSMLQLAQQKQDAITQANQDFNNNLLKITQARAQTDQDKAAQRLSALMDYRNKIFTIEQQQQQFAQTLALQKQQASTQLSAYEQLANQGLLNANQTTTEYSNSLSVPASSLQAGVNNGGLTVDNYTGQIAPRKDDLIGSLTNNIGGSVDYWLKTLGLK